MKKILLSLDNMDDFPIGLEWIINIFKTGEYPINKTQSNEWAMNFHLHLSDFRKLLCNFEADTVTSILEKVYEQHHTRDIRAMYEMFGYVLNIL